MFVKCVEVNLNQFVPMPVCKRPSFPLSPSSASLSWHEKLNQRLSQESLSHLLVASNWYLMKELVAKERETPWHRQDVPCVALVAFGQGVVGGRWRWVSFRGILDRCAGLNLDGLDLGGLEGQKGDLGGIRRAVPWARSGSRLSCGALKGFLRGVEKLPAIAWHPAISFVPLRDHALRCVLRGVKIQLWSRNFSETKLEYEMEHARK